MKFDLGSLLKVDSRNCIELELSIRMVGPLVTSEVASVATSVVILATAGSCILDCTLAMAIDIVVEELKLWLLSRR